MKKIGGRLERNPKRRKPQEKSVPRNPTKNKKNIYKKKKRKRREGARLNPRLTAAAPSPQLIPLFLFFPGLRTSHKTTLSLAFSYLPFFHGLRFARTKHRGRNFIFTFFFSGLGPNHPGSNSLSP